MTALPKLDCTHVVKALTEIGSKQVTVRRLAGAIVNGVGTKGNDTIWNMFVKKLSSSKTDRLGEIQDAMIQGINVPFAKLTRKTLDTKISAWKAYNCYTELWRARDASHIERESTKMIKIGRATCRE